MTTAERKPLTISISEGAADHVRDFTKQAGQPDANLRVGVKGGGCSGFSYILDLTESKKQGDEQWDFDFTVDDNTFNLSVICDPKSYLYINGTTLDFKDEVMGRGFVFDNPNASSSCGCGSSFST